MQVTLKQSDIHILTHRHTHTRTTTLVIRFCFAVLWMLSKWIESFGFAFQSSNRLVAPLPASQMPPPTPVLVVAKSFAWPKWKPQLCFLFLFYFPPIPVPSEKLSTFCSRLAARLVPLFNFIVRLSVCLSVILSALVSLVRCKRYDNHRQQSCGREREREGRARSVAR